MRRLLLIPCLLAAILWSAPCFAQARSQLGPLCTTDTTPADQMIDACTKIIALKVFSGEKLATIYFWRAVGWNKKGNYAQVIADATEALRLKPSTAVYNLRGSAYYDKGEYDIAIADFNDALRIGPPSGIIFHNRGNAYRGKGDYAKAIADYDAAIKAGPKSAFSYQNRGASKQALGDLDGALADINEAVRIDPSLPQPLISRAVIWRAKGDIARAIADTSEAIRLAKAKAPANIMTPPGSVLISAYTQRGLAYEAKGDAAHAKEDYASVLEGQASDAGSKANQATAKVRLALLKEADAAPRKTAAAPAAESSPAPAPPAPAAAAPAAPAARVQAAATGRRVALVIGNGAYAHVKALPNPPNDARAIAKSLRDIGFTVSEGLDLDRDAMQTTIHDFLREAARSQIAVVYYAGHGVQVDGRNYLVPVDIEFKAGGRMTDAMVDMDTIMAGLDDQIRTNILILDACRNNPMAPQVASTGPSRGIEAGSGLAAPASLGSGSTLGAGTLIAFATAPGQVALDGEGANSPFSAALSRHVGTPGLEVQQMLTRVRAEVVAATKGKQVPWSNSSLLGEVYLAEQ
ncbi:MULTISPECIES: caspase family protein [unclassified Bradyrhizobium]|uniref:caspase family protein n=1 Tax=unclassified Bradyrhizobium TaxID=2631580 RepID=UPI001BA55B65|nr:MULTISPECIES: caspase family protein [unclassified Bradyrhizobium]MBR1204001.1 caspase family protein [Bradyrhizobium sp. AUGA SZCCT0124]MBR1310113.1 caspase family protein [Bradyrhizobium sp. AUGA SZCCT0051]MBR1340254.1 caspase family protein [Bradyrhizobium sp. AUGA SZCCT0105]MBR1354861.1 caspase family protein [Bradyrhizobium sp. AUGA SZCCT0045]